MMNAINEMINALGGVQNFVMYELLWGIPFFTGTIAAMVVPTVFAIKKYAKK